MDKTAQLIDTIFSFSRCLKEKMGVKSEVAHLTMVQLQTLVFITKHSNSSMGEIAEFLQVELPSATNVIDNLVKLQMVARSQDNKDKRKVTIALTDLGNLLLKNAKKQREENMRNILQQLSEDDKIELLRILQKLTERLEKTHEK